MDRVLKVFTEIKKMIDNNPKYQNCEKINYL